MTLLRGERKRWRIGEPEAGGLALAEAIGAPTMVGQLLWRRGVRDAQAAKQFFEPKLTDLHDPGDLPGVEQAAVRIVEALRANQSIVIYGDYDVDGVTASAILFHTLKAADPDARVGRYIPHRLEEGYGLNREAIERFAADGVDLVISVDCGITAVEPAAAAKNAGLDLIITDHHEIADTLPDAHTLVHPRLNGDGPSYPFPDLCGAGVAYKLAWQIARQWCGSDRVSETFRELLVNLLSLAALGTVADVVPLVGENRTIVHFGLSRIKHTPFVGLNALIDASDLRGSTIDSYHVGFVLGPRLNACGRMGHAKRAVKLLTDPTPDEAATIARFLNGENDKRRATERRIFFEARDQVKQRGYDRDDVRAIVLADDDWHAGVVGIVCSRLVETFGRPAVLLRTADGLAEGSARSVEGFNIHEAFRACEVHLTRYGGHAMAAGLRLEADRIDGFRQALIDYAGERLAADDLTPVLDIDAEVALDDLITPTVQQIHRLAPFGRHNPQPLVLIRDAVVQQPATTMGREAKHLSVKVKQGNAVRRCIAWNMGELAPRCPAGVKLDLAAHPMLNTWNGTTNVELVVEDLRFAAPI